jgi:hypothetical protein
VKLCFWLLLGGLIVQPLTAQTVVRPDPPLDSTRAALREVLVVLRDSLSTVDGAAARLQRDYQAASGPSLLSRARVMRDACSRSSRTIRPTRDAVLAAKLTTDRKVQGRKQLVMALDTLKGVLLRCETEFAAMSKPDQAERVRGYGNDRAVRVLGGIRKYEQSMRHFLGLMGIRITPLGASPTPLAG